MCTFQKKRAHDIYEPRRVPKKPWSKAEGAAVMHFGDHICDGKLATKNESSHFKLVESSVLAQRTVQNICDFVTNRGMSAKWQSQKKLCKPFENK